MNAMAMLTAAMEKAKSTDPTKVALALEGMKIDTITGEVMLRADNHQVVQPIFVSTFSKANGKDVKFDVERTGFGFKTDARIEGEGHGAADHLQVPAAEGLTAEPMIP